MDLYVGGYPPYITQYFSDANKTTITILAVSFFERINNNRLIKTVLNKMVDLIESKERKHYIYANNRFVQQQFYDFTGISIDFSPPFCNYITKYNWKGNNSNDFLISRHNPIWLSDILNDLRNEQNINFNNMGDFHGGFDNLTNYKAIIYIPYTVSVMSFYEFYAMSIPFFY